MAAICPQVMSVTHSRLLRVVLGAVLVLVIYGVIVGGPDRGTLHDAWSSSRVGHAFSGWTDDSKSSTDSDDLGRVANRTLGFQEVIGIGLPERSDKRDALSLMAALSGFDLAWIDGVPQDTISDKAIPFGIDLTNARDSFLGSWRGHMNAIRHIVETGISSALILEDDMDWDVHIKDQLHDVARGARHLFPAEVVSATLDSPYGNNWDILWLGHCGEPFPENLPENGDLGPQQKQRIANKYIVHDDSTVPPVNRITGLIDWSLFPAQTRIVHHTAAPICTFAYALSQRAARNILYALSIDGLTQAFDNSLSQLCRDSVDAMARQTPPGPPKQQQRGVEKTELEPPMDRSAGFGLKCVSVNPAMMFHHKPRGRVNGDSDIQHYESDAIREQGWSENLQWSMRLNIPNVMSGAPLQPQFPED